MDHRITEDNAVIQELLQKTLATDDLDEVCKACSLMLGNPLCVIDDTMRLLAYYPKTTTGDADWDTLIENGFVDQKFSRITARVAPYDLSNARESQSRFEATDDELAKIRCPIVFKNTMLGGAMLLARDRPITEDDRDLLAMAMICIADILSKAVRVHGDTDTPLHQLLRNLVHGDKPDERYATLILQREDLRIDEDLLAVCAPYRHELDKFAPYWEWNIASIIPGSCVTHDMDALLGFIPISSDYESSVENLATVMESLGLRCAVSGIIRLPSGFRNGYLEAQDIFELESDQTGATVIELRRYFSDLFFHDQSVRDFLKRHPDRRIETLAAYDRQHGTTYCDVLYQYLFNFSNIALTSKKMYLHRNTLTYRLGQIAQITGADLKDPETCHSMLLNLRMRGGPSPLCKEGGIQ